MVNFDGFEIFVFGVVKCEEVILDGLFIEVIVIVLGLKEFIVVCCKERWFGIWVNMDFIMVDEVFSFYVVVISGLFDEIISLVEDLCYEILICELICFVGVDMNIKDV